MRIGDGSSDVCSADLSAPSQIEKYDLRRQVQGESMYASLRIERQDTVGRAAFGKVNVVSFGAPVLLLCHFPKMMKEAQWVDVGIWLKTIMLLLRGEGLDSCPQEYLGLVGRPVKNHLGLSDGPVLFRGLAIGWRSPESERRCGGTEGGSSSRIRWGTID